ncbi:protein-disulfide isomerase [Rheinheimera sp. A13L]|uniref:bifunctional protein-disulfide isomerase/oxidoreductase DsbC n=1 Tax=Rheinheimera sp. A13L TaxID=506534 RepID=UPI0002125541|nr:bifunctional protein-disulfide isomerase/oxidoreductase DsbC [Rheinheimera sp. A13L]EGM78650.1 protein-disulfide isomerase [Rheinheimera sp. A13L]
MKKFSYLAVMAAFLSTGLTAQVSLPEVNKAFSEVGLNVKAVADSTVPGMLQVQTDKGLFFMSENKQYLFEGNIYDLKNKKLVNEDILKDIRKAGVKEFNDSAIEFKAADEKYVVHIFTDTSCGYCRKLHDEMADFNKAGITVRYLAFPRGGVQSATYDELQSIWCAKDTQQAMTDGKAGKAVKQASCKNTVAQQYELGQSFGINGTPALILPDGRLIPGYQPAAALAATLSQEAP